MNWSQTEGGRPPAALGRPGWAGVSSRGVEGKGKGSGRSVGRPSEAAGRPYGDPVRGFTRDYREGVEKKIRN